MIAASESDQPSTLIEPRSRVYLAYLVVFLGSVALMDGYLSSIKATAIPYILQEYGITAPVFSGLESLVLISTFFVFLLNHLADVIGRKPAILLLILGLGLSSLAILLWTPALPWFMLFYAAATFFTVSNLWNVPISEEAPAARRGRIVSITAALGLLPLQALLPPLMIDRWGLNWRWMYGVQFLLMLPLLVMWLFMRETARYQAVEERRTKGLAKRRFNLGLGMIDRRDLGSIALSASILACLLVFLILSFWTGYYFITLHGFTLSQWSLVFLADLTMLLLGTLLGGVLMDIVGRKRGLIIGCVGSGVLTMGVGFAPVFWSAVMVVLAGFFLGVSSSWATVYVPEIFPTERRATCVGWVTAIGRIAYVAGPALAALLLRTFPTMEGFWVMTGLVMIIPISIIIVVNPEETRQRALEEISAIG